ncbi:MAG: glutathione S-transferase C-terminal domain-containing protein [Alphaproteobacteria bacterium]|nr:glutathione S-transferase C-terminal domain-containing protein [Alphaproteobacteria bacterium]
MIDVHFVPTPNGHKVSMALEEMGLEHRLIRYDMLKGDHLTPAFRRINPNARLPAIVDHAPSDGGDPFPVFESGAILVYLAEKSGKLMPAAPRRRSLAMQWLMWQMAGLGPMHGQAHHFIRYAPDGNPYAVERYTNEARRLLAVLNRRLRDAEYLAEEYSIADISAWPWVRAARVIGFEIAEFSHIKRWFDAISIRPAVVAGTSVANPALLSSLRVPLTAEQWSNLFGQNMLASAESEED